MKKLKMRDINTCKPLFPILLVLALLPLLTAKAQQKASGEYHSKMIEANGVRLHYLDFGGEGLPIKMP